MVIPIIQLRISAPISSVSLVAQQFRLRYYLFKKYQVISGYYLAKKAMKMSQKMVRMSFTVPPSLRADLDYLSHRMGVTKSALVSELLGPPLGDLRSLMEMVPENPTDEDVLRARGKSNELILKRLQSLRSIEGDLFDDRQG